MKESRTFMVLSILLLCLATHLSYGQGSRYTGNYIKSSPIQHAHKNNIVIEGLEFTNSNPSLFGGRAISLWKCENVIIRNCKFTNVAWETAILVENGLNVTITDCVFENVYQAVRVPSGRGNIKFENNEVRNLVKGLHNGNGAIYLFKTISIIPFYSTISHGNAVMLHQRTGRLATAERPQGP